MCQGRLIHKVYNIIKYTYYIKIFNRIFDCRMWSSVVYEEEKITPCSRSKHSVTLLENYLYLLAGRNGNIPLKDFWRFDLCT